MVHSAVGLNYGKQVWVAGMQAVKEPATSTETTTIVVGTTAATTLDRVGCLWYFIVWQKMFDASTRFSKSVEHSFLHFLLLSYFLYFFESYSTKMPMANILCLASPLFSVVIFLGAALENSVTQLQVRWIDSWLVGWMDR